MIILNFGYNLVMLCSLHQYIQKLLCLLSLTILWKKDQIVSRCVSHIDDLFLIFQASLPHGV